jgi:hypothetical protein
VAKLPAYVQQYGASSRKATAADFGAAEAGAMQQFGQSVSKLGEVMDRAYQAERVRKKDSVDIQAAAMLEHEIAQISRNPEWQKHEGMYDAAVGKIEQWSKEQFDDDELFEIWKRDFRASTIRGSIKVKTGSLRVQKDVTTAQTMDDLRLLANLASQTDNPTEKEAYILKGETMLLKQLKQGLITHVDHSKQRQDFLEEVAGADVRALIRRDPQAAVNRLQDNKDPLVQDMDASTREIWVDRALRAYEQDLRSRDLEQRRRERRADRAERRVQIETSKEAEELDNSDDLTLQWLSDNRDKMSITDYRYFYQKVNGERAETEENLAYVKLSDRAYGAETEYDRKTIWEDADNAFLAGEISKPYRDTIHRIITEKKDDWTKSTRSYISGQFGPDELLIEQGAHARKAKAMFEWDQWVRNNPNASPDEGEEKANELLKAYNWKPEIAESFMGAKLRYGAAIPMTMDELRQINSDTLEAYESGEITRDVFTAEMDKIRQHEKRLSVSKQ